MKLSAGLCDDCKNCSTSTEGDGVNTPIQSFPICKKLGHIIEPARIEDTENQTLECNEFSCSHKNIGLDDGLSECLFCGLRNY